MPLTEGEARVPRQDALTVVAASGCADSARRKHGLTPI